MRHSANAGLTILSGAAPGTVAVLDGEDAITYGQLREGAGRLAAWLRAEGVVAGEHVALAIPAGATFATAYLGILLAGAVAVPLDPGMERQALAFCLDDAGVRATIASPEALGAMRALDVHLGHTTAVGGVAAAGTARYAVRLEHVLAHRAPAGVAVPRSPGAPGAILYGRGHEGALRGAVLSVAGLAWAGHAFAGALGLAPDVAVAVPAPWSGPLALASALGGALAGGATVTVGIGGDDRLAGCYGTAETGGVVTVGGRPVRGVEVAVRDAADADVPPATVGELVVRGPTVMLGYHDRPAATRAAIDAAGWLRTGRRGWLDGARRVHLDAASEPRDLV